MKAKSDSRTPIQLREHYEVEKELANKLRQSHKEERRFLYGAVYNELFRRVTHHPMLTRKIDDNENYAIVTAQIRLLKRFLRPDCTFLELGAGDCRLVGRHRRVGRHRGTPGRASPDGDTVG